MRFVRTVPISAVREWMLGEDGIWIYLKTTAVAAKLLPWPSGPHVAE